MGHTHSPSPLARPLPILHPIKGVTMSAVAAGIRYQGRNDLMLMCFTEGTVAAGVFTKNSCPGAPIPWCRKVLAQQKQARALLVNSGNANVFTGKSGDDAVRHCAAALAQQLKCDISEIYLASTGVIGQILPYEKIVNAIPLAIKAQNSECWAEAAHAIMTTDTFPKAVRKTAKIGEKEVVIQGIAKGSGMIAPDMATMLSYIVTDANISQNILQDLLNEGVKTSFNAITVDSDTSTSDMVMVFATKKAENTHISSFNDPTLQEFRKAFFDILHELALLVIRDGEGATKLIKVTVAHAVSDESARIIAQSIANSPLVKTAIAGEDANWGRIVMAVGKSGQPADRDKLSIALGSLWAAENGTLSLHYDEEKMSAYMRQEEINILADIGLGSGQATLWTCDLTHGYIDINGSYRS